MRLDCCQSRVRFGFTLMEILIAVVVFGIVLAAMNAVFYGALRLRNKTVAQIEAELPLERALFVIRRDLENLKLPGGLLSGELQTGVAADGDVSPEFWTSSGLPDEVLPWSSVQRVSYQLSSSEQNPGSKDLYRIVFRNLLPGPAGEQPEAQWLLGGLERFSILFYDGALWREQWDSATDDPAFPTGLKVVLEFAQTNLDAMVRVPVELIVPVTVQARTNSVAAEAEGGRS